MKKYLVSVFAVVALLASACSKEDTKSPVPVEPQAQTGKFVFDVQVGAPETKAVKTGWEVGDEFIVFFNNDVTLGHTLTLTYNGTKWIGQFADQEFAEEFVAGKTGYCCGFSAQEASDITSLNNELRISAGGVVIFANATTYNISEEGDALHFNANFSTYYGTRHQFTITDISTDDGVWRLEGGYRTVVDGEIYGGDIDGVAPIFFDGSRVGRYSQDYVIGIANADGVAFNGSSDYDAHGDLVLKLTNTTTNKVYYRIIPEGRIPSLKYADAKAYKLAFSSFTEQTEATGLVRDADYHYYRTVTLKDGKEWMADNYRYVPEGYTPYSTLEEVAGKKVVTNVAAGVYCPVVVSDGAAAFGTDIDAGTRGYLYQTEVALGVAVNSLASQEEAEALEGTKGICPDGWHIPTISEITGLVGKAVSPIATNTAAPYYNGTYGSIAMLNADGFGIGAYGAVSVNDNTKTTGTLMGALSAYPDRTTSGYYIGSSFATISLNTDESIKNIQFWALMPMSNKASENEYTCNGSKLSYKIAASVRCVRD